MSRQTSDRVFTVDGDPFIADTDEALQYALAEMAVILTRIGGAFVVLAEREEIAPGMYETGRFIFKWQSYSPGKRDEAPAPVPVQQPVEEPVAA